MTPALDGGSTAIETRRATAFAPWPRKREIQVLPYLESRIPSRGAVALLFASEEGGQ